MFNRKIAARKIAAWKIVLALCAGLAACATGSGDGQAVGELKLSPATWDYFQKYLRDIGSTGSGAFAVSRDGGSAFYQYCPGVGCIGSADYRYQAVKGCKSHGQDCVVFAFGRDILVKYKLEN